MTTTRMHLRHLLFLLIGGLLAPAPVSAQEQVLYFHTDAIGSVRAITDAGGAQVAVYDYMPFGELPPTNPPQPPDTRQFAGKERDFETTELDYFGARYYRPESGRFTTVDPGHVAGSLYNPQTWNAYSYALNNPFRFVDPFGLSPCPAPTDTSTCVEGRKSSGEFAVDYVRWAFESWVRQQLSQIGQPSPDGVYGGGMPAPPVFRGIAGSIRTVNPTRSLTNCVNCAIATDLTLAGKAASAVPSGATSIGAIEAFYGATFARVNGRAAIEAQLLSAGNGARGIIFARSGPGQIGHVFNGVNQNGTVRFLDGQIGTSASFDGYREFFFLWTRR